MAKEAAMLTFLALTRHRITQWLLRLHTTCILMHVLIVLGEVAHKSFLWVQWA